MFTVGQQRHSFYSFYVKCVGNGTLNLLAPLWKTSVIYASSVVFCFHILHQITPAKLEIMILLVSIIIYCGENV